MIVWITLTSNTVAKNFHYFKLKGYVIIFPPDQSERPPGMWTNEIEAVSWRLSKAEFQPAQAQAAQARLSSVNWPGQNKLGIIDLNWNRKFLATVFGDLVISFPFNVCFIFTIGFLNFSMSIRGSSKWTQGIVDRFPIEIFGILGCSKNWGNKADKSQKCNDLKKDEKMSLLRKLNQNIRIYVLWLTVKSWVLTCVSN